MRRAHLAVQAALVLTVVAFVGWPEFRPVRARSIWRYAPATVLQARTTDAERFTAFGAPRPSDRTSTHLASPAIAADGVDGVARTSLNAAVPYAHVVLRDLRSGDVAAQTIADGDGQFAFVHVGQNIYLIELLGPDGAVVGISGIVDLTSRELQHADVRVPASAGAVNASLAGTLIATAPQATRAASDTGVTRTTPTEIAQVSPR